jgi:hypothetical protein
VNTFRERRETLSIPRLAVIFAAIALLFGVVGAAQAGSAKADRPLPQQPAGLGLPTTIRVVLRSSADGKPVAHTPVVFHTDATFAGVVDEIELGRANTNADGVAMVTFEPHIAGDHEVRVDFEDVGRKVNLGKVTVSVAGNSQLTRSTAGILIPGLNVWLLVALIAAVWSILLCVAFCVIAIARGGDTSQALGRSLGRTPEPAVNSSPSDAGGSS